MLFNIGCRDDIDILFKLAEIFDSLEPGTFTFVILCKGLLT